MSITSTLYRYYQVLQKRLANDERDLDERFDAIMAGIDAKESRRENPTRASAARRRMGEALRGGTVAAAAVVVVKITNSVQGAVSLALAVAVGSVTAAVFGMTAAHDPRRRSHPHRRKHNEVSAPCPQRSSG